MRQSSVDRITKETNISATVNLDGKGNAKISTGVGFFDHMLTALAVHGGFDINVECKGDLEVDVHHSVEDVGIVLGQAFKECIGDKAGIARFGNFTVPMDEALATCCIDISGREYLVFDATFKAETIGDLDTQMIIEFFRAFANNTEITLHINLLYGDNDHHKCEAIFKVFAHALRIAVSKSGDVLLTTKGTI